MRKLFAIGSLVALTATLVLSATGTALANLEVTTYVGCDSLSATPVPSHECEIGDSPGGYLEANEDLVYDICTNHPNGESVCEIDQNSFASILFGNVIVAKEVGQYVVKWTKTGEGSTVYGSWAFTMKAAEPPPLPPPATHEEPAASPAAPVVVPSPPTTGPSIACLAARARTKTLAARLKKASKKKKPKVRAKLQKARAALASTC